MLEIIALVVLWGRMGDMLRRKGWQKPIWMQLAVVFTWFGSMLFGSMVYSAVLAIQAGQIVENPPKLTAYLVALLSGIAGVSLLFLVAHLLPSSQPPPMLPQKEPGGSAPPLLQSRVD